MITIIGATGNIGSKVADILINEKHHVRLIARTEEKLKKFQGKADTKSGDANDEAFLSKALEGSIAVLTMLPTILNAPDVYDYQNKLGTSIANAIKNAGVKYVVNISSLGGHTESNNGIVAGLCRQEQRLNAIKGLNVLHLRPAYFMENSLNSIGLIKNMGLNAAPIINNFAFPVIATKDIAAVAAEKLVSRDFSGSSVLPLMGAKDYNYEEFTRILGDAVGKPNLQYTRISYDEFKDGLMQFGVSPSVAHAFVDMNKGISMGVMTDVDKRTPESTTPTTAEEFANTVFKMVYGMEGVMSREL